MREPDVGGWAMKIRKLFLFGASKPNISTGKLANWDLYKDKKPDEILASIYAYIDQTSIKMCAWYWTSINTKRKTSLAVRSLAIILLILGTTLPIFAALQKTAEDKLFLTQLAVGFLAIAGLTQVADKVFGWSSGWIRYVSTVTTMENLTRAFQMEWARYLASKTTVLDAADVKALFELGKGLEQELTKLQAEETTKWIAEFNTGISLLEGLIKTQREETDKKLEAIRTSLTTQEATAKAEEKAKLSGALEVTLTYKAEPKKVKIAMDKDAATDFLGNSWSRVDLSPGRHVVRLTTMAEPPRTIERIAEIKAESTTKMEIVVGE